MNIWYLPWFHSANNELYIKLQTQVTSRVPFCCILDKTFTSLNKVKHVESLFENPDTVWGCTTSSKQQEELLEMNPMTLCDVT